MFKKDQNNAGANLENMSGPSRPEPTILGLNLIEYMRTILGSGRLSPDERVLLLDHMIELKGPEMTVKDAAALCDTASNALAAQKVKYPERLEVLQNNSLRLLTSKLKSISFNDACVRLASLSPQILRDIQALNTKVCHGSSYLAQAINYSLAKNAEQFNIEELPAIIKEAAASIQHFPGSSREPLFTLADRVFEVKPFLGVDRKIEALIALSEAGIYRRRLFTDILKEVEGHYADLNSGQLAELACGLSHANPHTVSSIERVVEEFTQMPEQFSAQESIKILRSALNLRSGQGQVEQAAARVVNAQLSADPGKIGSDELVDFIWSCAFSGMDHLSGKAWNELRSRDPESISPRASRYLLQACIVAGEEMPINISDRIHEAKYPDTPGQNKFESQVGRALRAAQDMLEMEGYAATLTAQEWILGFPADFLMEVERGGKVRAISIECDGVNFHRLGRSPDGLALGKDVMKDLSRKVVGVDVLRIPSSDWENLASRADQIEYLLERIRPKLPK